LVGAVGRSKEPFSKMKFTPWYLAALFPFVVLGMTGALTAQLAILLVVFGIFFGTLSLNPSAAAKVAPPAEAMGDAE
jgi:hypothetical protein